MRILFLILLLIFTFQSDLRAQSKAAKSVFENGVNAARAEKFDEALQDFQNLLASEKSPNALPKKFRAQVGDFCPPPRKGLIRKIELMLFPPDIALSNLVRAH